MASGETLYAGCVLVNEAGILIRGDTTTGKSTLARELIFNANVACRFARLISDDRTRIEAVHNRLVARPVAPIAGKIEVRGLGILPVPFEPGAVIRLVIDLYLDDPPRYPEIEEATTAICGVLVPRLATKRGTPLFDVVMSRLSGVATMS